jgi:hypothetical protein
MTIPGFTADNSLYANKKDYNAAIGEPGIFGSDIVPQISLGGVGALGETTITIEPEQCVTRCFYFRGVRLFCYEMCF